MNRRTVWMLAMSRAFANGVGAQQFVYPAKGQSPQQQKSDEPACYSWAVEQSGFDPAKPPAPAAAAKPPTTATGTTPGAGARGAARGAVVGEVVSGMPERVRLPVRLPPADRAVGRLPPRRSRASSNSRRRASSSRRLSGRRALHVWRAAATRSSKAYREAGMARGPVRSTVKH
jgi:hypothetical protein